MKNEIETLEQVQKQMDSLKERFETNEKKIRELQHQKKDTPSDDDIMARLENPNPLQTRATGFQEIETLTHENSLIRQGQVILQSKIEVLKNQNEYDVRKSFLEKRRNILKLRAELTTKLIAICQDESDLENQIYAKGVPANGAPFNEQQPSFPGAMLSQLQRWMDFYKLNKFEQ